MDTEHFQTKPRSAVTSFFLACKNTINMNNPDQKAASKIRKHSTIYLVREIWHYCMEHSNFLLFLIWYLYRLDIKFKKSMKKKIAKKKDSSSSRQCAQYLVKKTGICVKINLLLVY